MMTRREFLEATAALTVAAAAGSSLGCSSSGDGAGGAAPPISPSAIPQRKLGRTGVVVSALGVGGWHIGIQSTEQESIRIIRSAIEGGITFLDNCWDYNAGESELRMGKALQDGYRQRVFLMTKFDGRDAQTATAQIDESLRRLQTDAIDLLQLHEVIWEDDPQLAFAAGGPIEAMVAAQKAGKVRFLGFTGHKSPDIHLRMLDAAKANGFRFDTVQMPLNLLDAHFDSFEKRVLPVLLADEIGVLGMKPIGAGEFVGALDPRDCLRYALSLPTSVVINGMDSPERVDQALAVGRGFQPLSESEVSALLSQSAPIAESGSLEKYKTAHNYDGTYQNKEWLGPRAPATPPRPG